MNASELYHNKIVLSLERVGFVLDPYDGCVANKMVDPMMTLKESAFTVTVSQDRTSLLGEDSSTVVRAPNFVPLNSRSVQIARLRS
jgi:hypothetical protein